MGEVVHLGLELGEVVRGVVRSISLAAHAVRRVLEGGHAGRGVRRNTMRIYAAKTHAWSFSLL